jgi:hypothetical protein
MLKKLSLLVTLGLFIGSFAYAQINYNVNNGSASANYNVSNNGSGGYNVTTPGHNVNTNSNGSVNVNIGNGSNSTSTSGTGGSVNVNVGGKNINVTGNGTNGSVNINGAGQHVQVNSNGSSLNIMVNGRTVNLDANKDSLSVIVNQGGSLTGASADTIVSLKGNSAGLIKNDDDLNAYADIVLQAKPAVRTVSVTSNGVSVGYVQPGRLFGIFGINMNATAEVTPSGRVVIKLPWYSFLVAKNTSTVTNEVQTNINGDSSLNVSVIGNSGASSGSNASVTVQNQAKVLNILASSVQDNQSASIGSGNSGINVTNGPNGATVQLRSGTSSESINIQK